MTKADSIALKQRLAGLSADQRARLVRRLGEDKSETVSSGGSPDAIPRARPLHVEEHPRVAVYPASQGQQRMWFLHHYAAESSVYCGPSAFHLVGPLNVAWLEAAFDDVIQRHDMLRTTFVMENGELFQRVAMSSGFHLQQINLEEIPDDTRKTAAERSLDEEACRPFELAAGPPFRAVLVRLQSTEHVLLLVLHHIISDGWSRSNLYRELSAAYAALAAGRPVPMRELPVQFADYSAWQKDWLEGGALETQTAYWKMKLAGELSPLDLPSDRARPATESFRGDLCSWRLEPGLVAALKTRAQEEGATLFMILLAAFKTLLHRYTGHDDLIVGVPIANRQRVEVEGLIGFFANTLVMRTTFPDNLTFRELLRRVKATAVEAYAHQDMPFERLVEVLQVRRDASRTPLFQATFALLDFPAVVFQLPGIQTVPWSVTTHTSKFDLSLTLERSAEGWTAMAEYSTDLFEAPTIRRLCGHFGTLLEAIATDPDRPISMLPVLTDAEQQEALFRWNREIVIPRGASLHERFEGQAARTPGAGAVTFGVETLSYAELNRRANRLAHHLRDRGVKRGDLVGLRVERTANTVLGILGILKAGATYLPMDPVYPRDRIAFMLEDSKARVVVVDAALAGDVAEMAVDAVVVESLPPGPETNLNVGSEADDLAYVIYTSGSTGRPKGCPISHYNVTRLFEATDAWFGFGDRDVWTMFHSYSFDFSVWEIWGALLHGGRVVVAPYWVSRSPDAFLDLLVAERVTVLNQTPSAFRQLVQADVAREASVQALRYVIFGGEALELQVLRPWFDRYGDKHPILVNMYGITETTVHVTYRPISRADVDDRLGSVIGVPIPDLQVYLLDNRGAPVPIGVPGEIFVGGGGVARGYLNRPELSAQRFVDDRFTARPGARLYRSGDLARRLANGDLEYLGRIDDQVKIRGFRIELGEIEAALASQSGVRDVCVTLREDAPGDRRIVAYVVVDGDQATAVDRLRTDLRERVPEYMVPTHFVALAALPLTPNGKLDRKSLPAPEYGRRESARPYAVPRTPTEDTIAGAWRLVLGVQQVGIDDNFFEIGGHSFLLPRVHALLRERVRPDLPMLALLKYPTVRSLAKYLDEGQSGDTVPRDALERAQRQRKVAARARTLVRKR